MDAAQILKPFANEHIPADTKETATAEHTSEIITMQNVNKSYKMGSGSLHVLKDISLTVEQGEYLAILGPSGSGKSTVAKLAAGLITPWSGEILIDGQPLESYSSREFYHSLATVDQSIMLFSGSVRDNLTLFRKRVNQAELNQALRDAAADGTLTETRIDESVLRILTLKAKAGLLG